jgi:branched-chain amino acid transport system permease protein
MGTLTGPLAGAMLVYLASEWMRGFGKVHMIVFSGLVVFFARFFRAGLWGRLTRRRARAAPQPAVDAP